MLHKGIYDKSSSQIYFFWLKAANKDSLPPDNKQALPIHEFIMQFSFINRKFVACLAAIKSSKIYY